MKFTKMSLVAALLIGSSAFAIENTKVSGDANVFYATGDNDTSSLFNKNSSAADIGLNLNLTTDLMKSDMISISAGVGATALTTLGLEHVMVDNVWGSAHGATVGTGASYLSGATGGAKVENAFWLNEAWVAVTAGKSTVKLGRMELDTPNAFTEKWSIEKNTFEAAVLINQDIPDTTLVGAYVGAGNGTENFGQDVNGTVIGNGLAIGPVVNENGKFTTYGKRGAFAIAAINNSFKPLTVQAWYYDVNELATSLWLQADLKCQLVPGLLAGVQYNEMKADASVVPSAKKNTAYAGMIGFDGMKDVFTAKVAYSQTNDDGSLGHVAFNTATAATTAKSKLYTEAWWNYGYVTTRDVKAYNVTVTSPVNGMFDLGLYYTNVNQSNSVVLGTTDRDLSELAISASKSFGPLDTTLAFVSDKKKTPTVTTDDETTNMVQVYLTVNF